MLERVFHFGMAALAVAITACSGSTASRQGASAGASGDAGPADGGGGAASGGRQSTPRGDGGMPSAGGTPSAGGRSPNTGGGSFGGVAGGWGPIFGGRPVGGAGGLSAGGGFGVGGSAPSGTSPIGKSCVVDVDCRAGLTCITSTSNVLGGGPAGGLCTVPCSADTDCTNVDLNSLCVGFDSASFCLQRCTEGVSSYSKCQGRVNQVCSALTDQFGNPASSACQPLCGSDFDCSGRRCDFRTGMCVDQLSGTLPIGSPCDPNASPDPCNGFCINFYDSQDPALAQYGVCLGTCSLDSSGVGCGVDYLSQPPFNASCLGPSTATAGDAGLCFQLCDCNRDCLNTAFVCRPWADAASIDATGRQGYCRGPVDSVGVPVPDLKCAVPPGP